MDNFVGSEQGKHSESAIGIGTSGSSVDTHPDLDHQQHPYPHPDSHSHHYEKTSDGSSSMAGQEKEAESPRHDWVNEWVYDIWHNPSFFVL